MNTFKRYPMGLLVCIIFSCLLLSCNDYIDGLSEEGNRFLDNNTQGLVIGKSYKFKYKESTCQVVANVQRKYLRLQSDDQSSYIHIEAPKHPSNGYIEKDLLPIVLKYKLDKDSEQITQSISMQILKHTDTQIWLWDDELKIGLILPV